MVAEVPGSIFRAYDIRGIFEDSLTLATAELIGKAIGTEVIDQGESRLAVARDGRLSGPALRDAFVSGVVSTGCDVADIGMVPSPVLYFATHYYEDLNSGVMITGSHNPSDYNGFKIVINGETLSGEAIQGLRGRISRGAFHSGDGQREDREVLGAYEALFLERHSLESSLKVVVDCGNGVAGVQAPKALEALGCKVIPLFADVDGTFPNHHPDPGDPGNLVDLIARVREEHADAGLAFDGDGDRLGVVTPDGDVVYPDILLMALAEDLVKRHPGARILFDVKCTGALFEVIKAAGGTPEMGRTGHSLIKARMKESGALLAGEMSGHIFFAEDWYGFDDALVAAARLLGISSRTDGGLQAVVDRYPKLCTTPEITIDVTDDSKFAIIDHLQRYADLGEGERCVIDGIRVDYADGWGLCRASNTSPKLVTRYEARDDASLSRIQARFEKAIDEARQAVG